MYTECPECQTTFRLTAQVLRQARGRVRCGGCGYVFDALDHLSEEMPGEDLSDTQVARAFEEQSRELLESFGDPSGEGDDVVIEDTGVEWRVLGDDDSEGGDEQADDVAAPLRWTFTDAPREGGLSGQDGDSEDDTSQTALDLGDEVDPGEMRFDDNTPLPDSFYRPVTLDTDDAAPDDDESAGPPPVDERQVDLALGNDDWQDLLAEVEADDDPAGRSTVTFQLVDNEAVGDEPGAASPATGEADDAAPDDEVLADRDEARPGSPDEEIDRQLLEAAEAAAAREADDAGDAGSDDNLLVETIIMEGDTITDRLVDTGEVDVAFELPALEPAVADHADESGPALPRFLLPAAVVLLAFALGAQLVHANREELATTALFASAVAPVYDALGRPVLPAWNVRGWQFQSTDGSTDAAGERLTIRSRIANRADEALPYPLVHLSLTDRFDEVIGSRILGPNDYLAGAGNPGARVGAGDGFTAVITVDGPAPEATGFKLNVCYPLAGDRLRCAIEDFRN